MTLLVTGASGFLGLNLLHRLLSDGRDVVAFSKSPAPAGLFQPPIDARGRLTLVTGDVRDSDLLREVLVRHEVSSIVHLAAITASAARERSHAAEVVAVNLAGLAAVVSEAGRCGVRRLLYTSSIGVFGPSTPDGGELLEDAPHQPATLYALTKSVGETLCAHLAALHGVEVTIARIGRVFGPFEYDTGVRDTLSQIYQVTRLARQGGRAWFARPCVKNWSYAPDVAADLACLLAAERTPHAVYHLGAPYAWSLADWCARLKARYPSFGYAVGGPLQDALEIDLFGDRDGARLSRARFDEDFGGRAAHDLDDAFEDYMRDLDVCDTGRG